jgi:hypothetical protein
MNFKISTVSHEKATCSHVVALCYKHVYMVLACVHCVNVVVLGCTLRGRCPAAAVQPDVLTPWTLVIRIQRYAARCCRTVLFLVMMCGLDGAVASTNLLRHEIVNVPSCAGAKTKSYAFATSTLGSWGLRCSLSCRLLTLRGL